VRLSFVKAAIFILCLLPLVHYVYGALTNQLGANPVEAMTRGTGDWALYLLWITLAVTPLKKITGWSQLIRYRRMLGLFMFFYASMHLLTYVWFDQFFNLEDILRDIVKRPFITIGFTSFVLLVPLAITSNNFMMRKLKTRWKKLHQLVYLISVMVLVHFIMMTKADYKLPLILGVILAVLLGFRLISYIKSQKRFKFAW